MKKDAKTFKEVAERCTRFCPCEDCGCQNTVSNSCGCGNSTQSEAVSCKNCTHYTPDEVCNLDLYREIVENHNL